MLVLVLLASAAALRVLHQPRPPGLARLGSNVCASRFPQRSPRAHITSCAVVDAVEPTSWLRNGTRLGYAVHAELGVVPTSMSVATPLPEVLVAIDPERYPSMSRARKACRRGCILVNGIEARCITTARSGDALSLQARVTPGFAPRGHAPFPLEVLFEDDAMAVVLKPAGVCTHPPPGISH